MSCISQNDFPIPQYVKISSIDTAGKAEWVHLLACVHLLGFKLLLVVWESKRWKICCYSLQYSVMCSMVHNFSL